MTTRDQGPGESPVRTGLTVVVAAIGLLVCMATSPRREPMGPPPIPENGMVVTLGARVEGTVELRCDDGARQSRAAAGQTYVVFEPLPAAGAECKLQLLGVPGSFGPVTTATRLVRCEARVGVLTCTADAAKAM